MGDEKGSPPSYQFIHELNAECEPIVQERVLLKKELTQWAPGGAQLSQKHPPTPNGCPGTWYEYKCPRSVALVMDMIVSDPCCYLSAQMLLGGVVMAVNRCTPRDMTADSTVGTGYLIIHHNDGFHQPHEVGKKAVEGHKEVLRDYLWRGGFVKTQLEMEEALTPWRGFQNCTDPAVKDPLTKWTDQSNLWWEFYQVTGIVAPASRGLVDEKRIRDARIYVWIALLCLPQLPSLLAEKGVTSVTFEGFTYYTGGFPKVSLQEGAQCGRCGGLIV